jgi:hypothetical protein
MKKIGICFLCLFLSSCSPSQDSNSTLVISNMIMAIAAILTAIIGAIAIFQETIRGWFYHPKLSVTIDSEPPDCQKTYIRLPDEMVDLARMRRIDSYYFRIKVSNSGNVPAENVEVFADELMKKAEDGKLVTVNTFLPMNLSWSHVGWLFFPTINPETYKHCDIFHIIDPKGRRYVEAEDTQWSDIPQELTIISFDTIVKPNALSHLVPVGAYQLKLTIAAKNAKSVTKTFHINLTGQWFENEHDMLTKGVSIS